MGAPDIARVTQDGEIAVIMVNNPVQYANTQLKNKLLFGSDYPVLSPDRWLKDFTDAGIKLEVQPLILQENAVQLLGLRDGT